MRSFEKPLKLCVTRIINIHPKIETTNPFASKVKDRGWPSRAHHEYPTGVHCVKQALVLRRIPSTLKYKQGTLAISRISIYVFCICKSSRFDLERDQIGRRLFFMKLMQFLVRLQGGWRFSISTSSRFSRRCKEMILRRNSLDECQVDYTISL